MKTLPKTIFVVLCNQGTEDEYLAATTDIDSLEDGAIVGTYQQYRLDKHEVKHSLIPVSDKKKRR